MTSGATLVQSRARPIHTDRVHVPALDGIRGVAISLVLLWHCVFGVNLPNHPYFVRIIALGRLSWSGVDLFFVLSGFLIGGMLLDGQKSQRYFASFYIRRIYRILPLYGVVVLSVLPLMYFCRELGATGVATENNIPAVCYFTFLQNFWMARHGWGSHTLGMTWSLAVEEQFYLTLPLIIRYVSRSRLWWIIGCMIVGAPLLRFLLIRHSVNGVIAAYVLTPCRADALGWGVAAALMKRTPALWNSILRFRMFLYLALVWSATAVVGLLLSRFMPLTGEFFGLEYSLLAVFYFLLLLGVMINGKLETIFSVKSLRYMGTIAYGLYLLHLPFIGAVGGIVDWMHPRQSGWLSLLVSIAGVGLATVAAGISWEHLEKPLIVRAYRITAESRYGHPQL
jgi:peptidoglycan/LPS O-acetylase OafA/YrhL